MSRIDNIHAAVPPERRLRIGFVTKGIPLPKAYEYAGYLVTVLGLELVSYPGLSFAIGVKTLHADRGMVRLTACEDAYGDLEKLVKDKLEAYVAAEGKEAA